MRFCTKNNCGNVLTTAVKHLKLIYRCKVCFEEYPLTDRDTLIFDESIQESGAIHKYRNYLQNAYADSIVELAQKKCPGEGCPETIVHVIKIAQNGQSLHICPLCRQQFE